MPGDITDLTERELSGPGAAIRLAARARRPRCWCGCPEAAHRAAKRQVRRSCRRCRLLGCPAYVPCNELGARVTSVHHVARARSDQRVRAALEALFPHARPAPAALYYTRIPHQRGGPGWNLRRTDL